MGGRWKLSLQARAKNCDLKHTKVLAKSFPFSIKLKISSVLIKLKFKSKRNSRGWKARLLRCTKLLRIFGEVFATKDSTLVTKGCKIHSADDAQGGIPTFFAGVASLVKNKKNNLESRTWLMLMVALAFLAIICCWILHLLVNAPVYEEACFPLLAFTNWKQERPIIPEDFPPDLAFLIQSCWVEDPNMRTSFSQISRMLNAFLFTLPPPAPSLPVAEINEAAVTGSSSITEYSGRARGKFAFVRQFFAAKKSRNPE